MRGRVALALTVTATFFADVSACPSTAWALCPNCLGQNQTLTPTLRIVGVFLLVPPAVFFAVARIIRRLER